MDNLNRRIKHGKNKKHGGTGLYEKAEWLTNLPNGSLRNYKWIAELFKLSQRRDNLSYEHHRTVSSIKKIEIVEDKKLP